MVQRSEILCANNITILRLLSEEVFDFGKVDMTSAKTEHLKTTLNAEFAQIFELCRYILKYGRGGVRPSWLRGV